MCCVRNSFKLQALWPAGPRSDAALFVRTVGRTQPLTPVGTPVRMTSRSVCTWYSWCDLIYLIHPQHVWGCTPVKQSRIYSARPPTLVSCLSLSLAMGLAPFVLSGCGLAVVCIFGGHVECDRNATRPIKSSRLVARNSWHNCHPKSDQFQTPRRSLSVVFNPPRT